MFFTCNIHIDDDDVNVALGYDMDLSYPLSVVIFNCGAESGRVPGP